MSLLNKSLSPFTIIFNFHVSLLELYARASLVNPNQHEPTLLPKNTTNIAEYLFLNLSKLATLE
jgi:hypothetical protein